MCGSSRCLDLSYKQDTVFEAHQDLKRIAMNELLTGKKVNELKVMASQHVLRKSKGDIESVVLITLMTLYI